jgi:hypothetical protein
MLYSQVTAVDAMCRFLFYKVYANDCAVLYLSLTMAVEGAFVKDCEQKKNAPPLLQGRP